MGIHLWRKHSYARVKDDNPGCIWTVFRVTNYHPWQNVRKMLPYKKHKFNGKSTKSKAIQPEQEDDITIIQELKEDSILKYSASVNSSQSSRNGSRSKRSIKARIRALIKEKNNSSTKSDLQGLNNENELYDDDSTPTLMSLLKANPKLIRSVSRLDDSSNFIIKPQPNVHHKEDYSKKEDDYVGVLELFEVDQDLFLRILQDGLPRKSKLVKSCTFPCRNPSNFGTTPPRKLEHKHKEIWPVSSNVRELRKVKSQSTIARSFSLTESLDKYGYLFDSNSNRAIKKHLSKSLRLINEKESMLLDDLNGRKTFKEGIEVNVADSEFVVEQEHIDAMSMLGNICERNDGFTSISTQQEENESIAEEAGLDSIMITSTLSSRKNSKDSNDDQFVVDYYNNNQDLQYVKYVLDIVGFSTVENQLESWHSQDQPLDPALFDGIEVCCPFEPKVSNKDDAVFCMSSSHRKVLFDLINEALMDVYENSYAYYPKALSIWCHVRPTAKGKTHVFEDVWDIVNKSLSWRPELDPTLDVAVAHDLSKNRNGWVNLQMDSEGVALELEDLIFNELLEEIVCC